MKNGDMPISQPAINTAYPYRSRGDIYHTANTSVCITLKTLYYRPWVIPCFISVMRILVGFVDNNVSFKSFRYSTA